MTTAEGPGSNISGHLTGRLKAASTFSWRYFFVALQAVPVPVVPFIELPLTVPV
jgi:hypothetical protein